MRGRSNPAGMAQTTSPWMSESATSRPVRVEQAHLRRLGRRATAVDAAGAAVAVGDRHAPEREPLAGVGHDLELVVAVGDAVVDDRQHPRGAALVAVDVADLLAARELHRRRVEVLAVGDRERVPVRVGEVAVVGEREPDRAPRRRRRRRVAATTGSASRRRRRGRSRDAGGLAMASPTRPSKPAGGSTAGARSRSSSARVESRSIRARHPGQPSRWSSAQARSSPSAMPSATSAAISRRCSQSAGVISLPPRPGPPTCPRRSSAPRRPASGSRS